jgi:hypothetical protein
MPSEEIDPRLRRAIGAAPSPSRGVGRGSTALGFVLVVSFLLAVILGIAGAISGNQSILATAGVFGIVLVATLMLLTSRMRRFRDRALPVLARQFGWRFAEKDRLGLAAAGLPFEMFRQRNVEVRNVAWGTLNGVDIRACDVRYEVNGGRDEGWQRTSWEFAAVADLNANCPELSVVKGAALAAEPERPRVLFESYRFNQEVIVVCADRYFATALVDERLMGWFLDHAPADVIFTVSGPHVLATKSGATEDPGLVLQAVWGLAGFIQNVPRVVGSLYPSHRERSQRG